MALFESFTSGPSPADAPLWLSGPRGVESMPLQGAATADVTIVGAGFTGLATAYFLKRAEPTLRVVMLERERVGMGASGRAAGIVSPRFGLGLGANARLFGKGRARDAEKYGEQAVELVERLVAQHRIDCGYARTGLLRVATSLAGRRKLQDELELAFRLGLKGMSWLDQEQAQQELASPMIMGAWAEGCAATVDPVRLLRGLRCAVESMGVMIYEHSPAQRVQRRLGRLFVETPQGGVLTDKLAYAVNAYSQLVPKLRGWQLPAFTHVLVSEPLKPHQRQGLGWQRRQAVEEARHFMRFARLTPDDRLLIGGRDLELPFGARLTPALSRGILAGLEADVARMFPVLRGVRFTHRWQGPISLPLQATPGLGFLGSERIAYSLGCMGHGIAMAHLNGWTLSDLLRGERTERTDLFFVNRRVLPWPPEPLRWALGLAMRGMVLAENAWDERPGATPGPAPFAAPHAPSPRAEGEEVPWQASL